MKGNEDIANSVHKSGTAERRCPQTPLQTREYGDSPF